MPIPLDPANRLDRYLISINTILNKPKNPPSHLDARRMFYAGKVVGIFWFEGKISKDPKTAISYYMNPDWPDSVDLPEDIQGIYGLSEDELIYICRRLIKPEWAKSPRRLRGKASYADLTSDWNKGL